MGSEIVTGFDFLVVGDISDTVVDGVWNADLAVPFGVGNLVVTSLALAFEGEADEDKDEGNNKENDDNDVGHVGGLQVYRMGGGAGWGIGSVDKGRGVGVGWGSVCSSSIGCSCVCCSIRIGSCI